MRMDTSEYWLDYCSNTLMYDSNFIQSYLTSDRIPEEVESVGSKKISLLYNNQLGELALKGKDLKGLCTWKVSTEMISRHCRQFLRSKDVFYK